MTQLRFRSHHPLSRKEGIIYPKTFRYIMIISEDHILQEELNNLTHILLAHAYPLHLIIENIKKLWPTTAITCYPNEPTDRNQHFRHCNSFLRRFFENYSGQL